MEGLKGISVQDVCEIQKVNSNQTWQPLLNPVIKLNSASNRTRSTALGRTQRHNCDTSSAMSKAEATYEETPYKPQL